MGGLREAREIFIWGEPRRAGGLIKETLRLSGDHYREAS